MQVQIFGTRKSPETRKALRFFAERRVPTHFVDVTERAASPRELERFAKKFGMEALLDRKGKRFTEVGLGHALLSEQRWMQKLAEDPLLLKLPLVRYDNKLTIGDAEPDWKAWLKSEGVK